MGTFLYGDGLHNVQVDQVWIVVNAEEGGFSFPIQVYQFHTSIGLDPFF
jgi:hypothetical protein